MPVTRMTLVRMIARASALAAVMVVSLRGTVLQAREPKAPAPPPSPVQLVLEVEHGNTTTGESVSVTATLRNNTYKDIVIDAGRLTAQGHYELLATDTDEVVDSGDWRPDRDDPEDRHPVTVRKRSSISRFLSLGQHELGDLAHQPGRIRVSLTFCDDALPGSSPEAPSMRCVSSNAVIVQITK